MDEETRDGGGFRGEAGIVQHPGPGIRLVVAPNPSPMTGHGTNSYILGTGEVAVIDPGPDHPGHLAALLAALGPGEHVAAILVTHAHLDHSPLSPALARATGAPVLAFGDAGAGRSAAMAALAAGGLLRGGEGVDHAFRPDRTLADGEEIAVAGAPLLAVHTPGHFGNHMSFAWRGDVFCGDHVMGWSTSLVSPPDGDMGAYMRSLDRLEALGARRLYPGHGAPVDAPGPRIAALRAHRQGREAAILGELARGPASAAMLAARLYADTPAHLLPAARRNVLAHLIDLAERKRVSTPGATDEAALFTLLHAAPKFL